MESVEDSCLLPSHHWTKNIRTYPAPSSIVLHLLPFHRSTKAMTRTRKRKYDHGADAKFGRRPPPGMHRPPRPQPRPRPRNSTHATSSAAATAPVTPAVDRTISTVHPSSPALAFFSAPADDSKAQRGREAEFLHIATRQGGNPLPDPRAEKSVGPQARGARCAQSPAPSRDKRV